MSDFTSDFWSVYIALITVAGIIACGVLLYANSKRRSGSSTDTTGHVWDENLAEWNNPLPRWWMWLFVITIIFSLVYLVLYPGLGRYAGVFGWTSHSQYEEERQHAAQQYAPIFDKYLKQDLKTVAADPEARQIGQRLFLTYCAQCHGSDAGGARGFPNLRDHDWLGSGEPEAIEATIRDGRVSVMPPQGKVIGNDDDVKDVAHYVRSLSGLANDSLRSQRGKSKFASTCAACHGAEAKGNPVLRAPNLTDDIWLYGGSEAAIMQTISKGRTGQMPTFKEFLDESKVHLLAAYVYGLPGEKQK
jgi:cytochrome c oxidase cbb3-type subunit III